MKKKIFIAVIVVVIVAGMGALTGYFGYLYFENETEEVAEVEEVLEEPEPEIKIYSGNDRPIAVMIDNNVNAQPQSAINSAYMVYEIIVEGGETRLMALFKGVDEDVIGPVRSARHYFLNYAMENDAIYVHFGESPQAESDIKTYGINNIDGINYDTKKDRTSDSLFWRSKERSAPHNAYTNTVAILSLAEEKGYRLTSDAKSVLNYVPDEVNLDEEGAIIANVVTIPYEENHIVEYIYDEDTGRYTRYSKGKLITDATTGEEATTKNIIITFAQNYTLDDVEDKGRQEVITVGELDGYYITNGKAIRIKCKKNSRSEKTVYMDLEGNEIEVNDGNTWVNICPINADVVID